MDYSYSYSTPTATSDGAIAVFTGMFAAYWLVMVAFAVLAIIANCKIFTKAGREGWKSIIPIYNMWVLFEIAGMEGALSLLLFVPIANLVVTIMAYLKLAKAFGKSDGFGIGLILLSPIFMIILAFDKSEYLLDKPEGATASAQPAAPTAPAAQPKPEDPWVNGQN